MADYLAKIKELEAERVRLAKEIKALKRQRDEMDGIRLERFGTGKLDLKMLPIDECAYKRRFTIIATGFSIAELKANASLFADKINEFCDKSDEELTAMMRRG